MVTNLLTLVTFLCLNHQRHFGVVWTSDIHGEYMVKVCRAAGHRFLRFYGGMKKPYHFLWLLPKNDFGNIKTTIINKNETNVTKPEPKERLELFFRALDNVFREGFLPEFFFPVWREEGLNYSNLPEYESATRCNFKAIVTLISIDSNFCSPFPEPNTNEEDLEEFYKEQQKIALKRQEACIKSQTIERSLEEDFFSALRRLQQAKLLEQRWLAYVALHHYLRNGVNNYQLFYEMIKTGLSDNYYLIRKEAVELLNTFSLIQPNKALKLIEDLSQEKDDNFKLFAFCLLKNLVSFLDSMDNDYLYLENPYPIKLTLNDSIASRIAILQKEFFDFQEEFLGRFQAKHDLWKRLKEKSFLKETIYKTYEKFELKEAIIFYNYALKLPQLLKKPFLPFFKG